MNEPVAAAVESVAVLAADGRQCRMLTALHRSARRLTLQRQASTPSEDVGGFTTPLAETHPAVELHVREHEPPEAMALLADDKVDLALVYDYNLAPRAFARDVSVTPLWTAADETALPAIAALAGSSPGSHTAPTA